MKKIRNLCIAIIALVGLSFSANAQNVDKGTTPAIATEHAYWVNSADGSALDVGYDTGNEYLWYVTVGDLTTPAPASDLLLKEYTAADPDLDGANPVVDLYRVKIDWFAPAATKTYYLHLVETSTALAGGCSNHKVQKILPFSNFQLAIANVTSGFVIDGDDLKVCAPDVALTLDGSNDVVYSYGMTKLYYKVDATNIDKADYTLGYNITTSGSYTGTAPVASYGTISGSPLVYSSTESLTAGGNQTQLIGNDQDASTIYIEVILENGTFEGLAEHNVTVTLISGLQALATADLGSDADENQIVPARPSTSGIGTDL